MKYCSHCGAEVRDEAVICVNCGCAIQQLRVKNNKDDGLLTAAKILMIISTAAIPGIGGLIAFIYLVIGAAIAVPSVIILSLVVFILCCSTMAWHIPMTISLKNKINNNEPISTGFKVCVLIFVSLIAGILLLCHDDD